MFIVLLKFAENKSQAAQFMQAHKDWIARGFEEGVFLLVGSLRPDDIQPIGGGGILAHGSSRAELEARVQEDPFVAEKVVSAEITEIAPAKADERMAFLLG